jgi:hypothetical protein
VKKILLFLMGFVAGYANAELAWLKCTVHEIQSVHGITPGDTVEYYARVSETLLKYYSEDSHSFGTALVASDDYFTREYEYDSHDPSSVPGLLRINRNTLEYYQIFYEPPWVSGRRTRKPWSTHSGQCEKSAPPLSYRPRQF